MTERRYYGIFKIFANQTRDSARQAREERHRTQPVAWLRAARPATMIMRACGHILSLEDALVEEAIRTAVAMVDKGSACRGGPWAHPHINSRGLEEAAEARRLNDKAGSPKEAREAVSEYAQSLGDDSYLKRHCLNLSFNRDSAEVQMGSPAAKRKRKSGKSMSGNLKRKSWGLRSGTDAYNAHKWGSDVQENLRRDNQRQQKQRR